MFRPTASTAITSASMPTCSWKPPRPITGSSSPATAATASLGHHPIRSPARCAEPSQDGRYSRLSSCLATHSSAPTCGPAALGCGSRLTVASYLLQLHLAKQAAWPDQHDDDQQRENEQVGECR